MKTAAFITIHGMGETKRGYADTLIDELTNRMSPQSFERLSVRLVYYQHLLQDNERIVFRNMEQRADIDLLDLRRFLLFGLADAAGLEVNKENSRSVYEEAQLEIASALLEARREMENRDGPVVFVAQSLGGQVLSSYIWDAQRAEKAALPGSNVSPPTAGIWRSIREIVLDRLGVNLTDQDVRFLMCKTMTCLVTTGCNIPIFVAAHKHMHVRPIERPNAAFVWHNFYDPQDVLGWPLRPLSTEYGELVTDHVINAGGILSSWNPMSHTAYWTDGDVLGPLLVYVKDALSDA